MALSFTNSLAGNVSIVTGGTRSVGEGIVKALARAGSTVYLTGSSTPDETACRIADETGNRNLFGIKLDHSDDAATAEFYERILQEQGGQLDILVNNAIAGAPYILADDYDANAWVVPL